MDFFLLNPFFNFHTTLNSKHIVNFIPFFTVYIIKFITVYTCPLYVYCIYRENAIFRTMDFILYLRFGILFIYLYIGSGFYLYNHYSI